MTEIEDVAVTGGPVIGDPTTVFSAATEAEVSRIVLGDRAHGLAERPEQRHINHYR